MTEQVDQKLEFPRNRLILDETIGEGEFGRVNFKISQSSELGSKLNFKVKSGRALDLPPKTGYTRYILNI